MQKYKFANKNILIIIIKLLNKLLLNNNYKLVILYKHTKNNKIKNKLQNNYFYIKK